MGRTDTEEIAADSTEWSGEETEESAYEEEAKTAGGAGRSERCRLRQKWSWMEAAQRKVLRVQRPAEAPHQINPRGRRRSKSRGPSWGRKRGQGEGRHLAVKPGWQVLWSGRERWGARGLRSEGKPRGGVSREW